MENNRFEDCMRRICCGDKEALKEIYESCHEYIFHLMLGITGNSADAEDLTVDFFLRLWEIADKYVPGNGYKRFLTVTARNLAMDFLRRKNREIPYASDELTLEADKKPGREKGYEEVLEDMSMEKALSGLSPAEREVVHLKVVGQLTFQNIADILKIPLGTVTWRYRQAIGKLRRCGYEAL